MSNDVRELLELMAEEAGRSSASPSPRMLRRAGRRRARSVLLLGLVAALVGYGGFAGVRALTRPASVTPAAPVACSNWSAVPSPNLEPDRLDNQLRAVAAFSSDDVWAVGLAYVKQEGGENDPLAMHWDGTRWTLVSVPESFGHEGLLAVDGTSSSDVWTIGNGHQALHWDGTTWTTVPLADPGTHYWHLESLSAVAPDDVWAAGTAATGTSADALLEHWDGTRWTVADRESYTPQPQTGDPYAGLHGIEILGGDGWAVGEVENVSPAGESNTLALHGIDGWRRIPTEDVPTPDGKPFSHLLAVSAVGPADVWAVGIAASTYGIFGKGDRALIEHWDGQRWTVSLTLPADTRLTGVLARSAGEAWAVGSTGAAGSFGQLILRWDGTSWQQVPTGIAQQAGFSAVAATPSGELWVAGSTRNGDRESTLVLRCGSG